MSKRLKYSKRVDAAVGRALVGNPINIMDIQRVYEFAGALEADGIDDEILDGTLRAYVHSIRVDINPRNDDYPKR